MNQNSFLHFHVSDWRFWFLKITHKKLIWKMENINKSKIFEKSHINFISQRIKIVNFSHLIIFLYVECVGFKFEIVYEIFFFHLNWRKFREMNYFSENTYIHQLFMTARKRFSNETSINFSSINSTFMRCWRDDASRRMFTAHKTI